MKIYQLNDLKGDLSGHIFEGLMDGQYIYQGGIAFLQPSERSHTKDSADGSDIHLHNDQEVFFILQGRGRIEINGCFTNITTGNIVVVEGGEDHHVISSAEDPLVLIWLHCGDARHENQLILP